MVAEAELAYWGGAIIVSVLAAGGMALATGDAQKVGSAMYSALKDTGGKAWESLSAMAAWAASAGSKVKDTAFRVGKDVWQTITDCFSKFYSDGRFTVTGSTWTLSRDASTSDCEAIATSLLSLLQSHNDISFLVHASGRYSHEYEDAYILRFVFDGTSISVYRNGFNSLTNSSAGVHFATEGYETSYGAYVGIQVLDGGNSGNVFSFFAPFELSLTDSVAIPHPDLKYPGDDYLVKAPDLPTVDTGTGAVSWPSDAVYNKDAIALPYPIDAAGQKVADIPFDVPVDQTTGKTLDDADTGTDTDKPGTDTDKPGTDTGGLLGQIVALLKNFFDSPSDFRLNMDGFRNLVIKDKFPFCIPFDMVDSVKQFAADAADYQFRVKLDTQYFKVDHVVDLTPLAVPLAFFRYLVVAWFAWVLMSRTHDLMKW